MTPNLDLTGNEDVFVHIGNVTASGYRRSPEMREGIFIFAERHLIAF